MKQLIDRSSSGSGAGLLSTFWCFGGVWKHVDRGDSATESGAGCHAFRREAQCGDTYGLLRMKKWRSEEIEK